jgi:hypothetical protein
MELPSSQTVQPRPSPKEAVPYSSAALRQDLQRVRSAWDDCQASRDRNAIYGYLNGVYGLVSWWAAEGREIDRARRALRLGRLEVSDREDPFAVIIRCTADPAKADKRTRSKWSRVMRYAAAYKPDSEPLPPYRIASALTDRGIRNPYGVMSFDWTAATSALAASCALAALSVRSLTAGACGFGAPHGRLPVMAPTAPVPAPPPWHSTARRMAAMPR